jgi:hypothetical protein
MIIHKWFIIIIYSYAFLQTIGGNIKSQNWW